MPDIKVESREHSLPPVATPSSDGTGPATSPEWDASMELALLKAVASCKPVGMHKHFRIMCVQRKFNETSPSPCSINEIWERLGDYYGMGALDELEEEDKEEKKEEEQQHGDDGYREFSLPSSFDYDQDDDTTRENSPAVERPHSSRRTRTSSRREVSPAVTESSVASTPEPEEGKATPTSTSSRRGRSTRRSDAGTPEPGATRGTATSTNPHSSSSSRRSGRVSTSSSSSSSRHTTTSTTPRRQSKRK